MTRKKRILWVNEASFLSTGYSTYGLEVLKRLHATGKYDLCELACYASAEDPRSFDLPWGFISAMPPKDKEDNPTSEFGEWKFEEACLQFRPDVVMDVRDWWMMEFQERSPFRHRYHWAIMPTVDAAPQDEQWVATFTNADAVFTYSDWAQEVLKEQGRGLINLKPAAPPGADLETLRPVPSKKAHREAMGVDPECLIVGTVMRNQRRKLYPDLVQAFALFLKTAPEDLAKKTYLYMHTSWPDAGWDIPRLINEAGIAHRCVFTYWCKNCGKVFPAFFQDARTVCRECGHQTAMFPNSHTGISRAVLGQVMNLFDVYVQYANSEGFGMPQVEAAACGVPVMAVDYSAMSDVVRKVRGFPIKVQRMFRESETHCWRALPDNGDFVAQLTNLLMMPEAMRSRLGYDARRAAETHYTYDKTAKVWETHFDGVSLREHAWDGPAQIHQPVFEVPQGLSDEEFVRWGIIHVAGRPELLGSYTALRMSRDLHWGATLPHMGGLYFNEASTLGMRPRHTEFNRDMALNSLLTLCDQKNYWEGRRYASLKGG